jgi:hypothetical protein
MRRWRGMTWFVACAALIVVIAGCAAGNPRYDAKPAGFWAGLWHGFIIVVAFVVSLFNDTVHMYEANNNGHMYDLGFVLGAMAFLGGGPFGSRCRRWRR